MSTQPTSQDSGAHQLQPANQQPPATPYHLTLSSRVEAESQEFELTQRKAKMLATSSLLPKNFQGNVADCALMINMASRLGMDALAIAQNIYIVHGKPSFSSSFLIAMINYSGRFGQLRFEEAATDGNSVRAWGIAADGEAVYGPWVSMKMAKAEGWASKSGSKWQTMPDLMLRYRAATFFARLYCPDITMGMRTSDEVVDIETGSVPVKDVKQPRVRNANPQENPFAPPKNPKEVEVK